MEKNDKGKGEGCPDDTSPVNIEESVSHKKDENKSQNDEGKEA